MTTHLARKVDKVEWRNLILLVGLGLGIRLLALPFSMTDDADSISRVWTAWQWLSDPQVVTHGRWGPLHTYLIGAAMTLVHDPVLAPILLSIVLSVATAVPLYLFTRNEFGNDGAALLVGLVYVLCPLAIRNSLQASSQPPFVFFVVLSMWLLSVARRDVGAWHHAVLGGLALTLAGMVRYEGWLLIPLLGLALWRKPWLAIIFMASASVFPVSWMVGNQIHYGDFLYSARSFHDYEVVLEGSNEAVTLSTIVKRLVFHPLVILLGLTPVVTIGVLAGAVATLVRRRPQVVWLVPVLGVLGFYLYSSLQGTLSTKGTYDLAPATLSMAFIAGIYNDPRVRQLTLSTRKWTALLVIVSIIPLSLVGGLLPFSQGRSFYANNIFPVPLVEAAQANAEIVSQVDQQLSSTNDGLISDFYGWGRTYYVLLTTRLHPDRIFIAPGAKYEPLDVVRLLDFVARHPTGVMVLQNDSRFAQDIAFGEAGQARIQDKKLSLQLVSSEQSEKPPLFIYRYRVAD